MLTIHTTLRNNILDDVLRIDTKCPTIQAMRRVGLTLYDLMNLHFIDPEDRPSTLLGYIELATSKSPMLLRLLKIVRETILAPCEEGCRPKKLLIVEGEPFVAFYIDKFLKALGITGTHLGCDLWTTDRRAALSSFNSKDRDSIQYLILTYRVGTGTNLHGSCNQAVVLGPATDFPMQNQATGRVSRVRWQDFAAISCLYISMISNARLQYNTRMAKLTVRSLDWPRVSGQGGPAQA